MYCPKDLRYLEIFSSLEEIEKMPYNKFKNIIKIKIKEKAFSYLTKKIRNKGKEIDYQELSMEEYLLPENRTLSIIEKQKLFEMKNKMTNIPSNFSKSNMKYECYCGNEENMKQIFYCKSLSDGKEQKIEYEKIYNGTVTEQREILSIFERNMKKREELKTEKETQIPCVLNVEPLSAMTAMG